MGKMREYNLAKIQCDVTNERMDHYFKNGPLNVPRAQRHHRTITHYKYGADESMANYPAKYAQCPKIATRHRTITMIVETWV